MSAPASSPFRQVLSAAVSARRIQARTVLASFSCTLLMLALSACSGPPAPTRVDALPMYGAPKIPRPALLRAADERFIKTAATEFAGDRKLASVSATGQADRALARGDLDLAMRFYNQAWLLDPENYEVYEGFARVLIQRGQPAEALTHLRTAIELCPDPTQRSALELEASQLSAAPRAS